MRSTGLLILVVAALAVPALAQDSVSFSVNPNNRLPGDALSPWSTTQQNANYVVDLTPFTASWGTRFAIAPLVKSSKGAFFSGGTAHEYFNDLISAQSISRLHAQNVPFATTSYSLWTNAPGYGVNVAQNYAPNTTSPTGLSNQFALVGEEFGSSSATASFDGIFGAVVNYVPSDPNRLYVRRILAATDSASQTVTTAAFGIGACDEMGNVMFRGDNASATGPNTLTGYNIFRVNMLARNFGMINNINNTAPADAAATTWIVQRNASYNHTPPNIGPAAKFAGAVMYMGENFNMQYGYGAASPVTYTTAHRPGTTDHRGTVAYMTKTMPFMGGPAGTAATISRTGADPALVTTISLWGVNTNGSVAGTRLLSFPNPITFTDNVTGETNYGTDNSIGHFYSQTAFRGGTSQVAMNVDQAGRLLVAAVVYQTSGGTPKPNNDPRNALVVARVSPDGTTTQWSMAAYSTDHLGAFNTDTGKPILDGPSGNVIGRLTTMYQATGGAVIGPSISGPAIDSVGNIWFISAVALYKFDHTGQPYTDYDAALIRAVYDPAVFGWRLEKVLEQGDIFQGANSGLPWTVRFISIADSNSVDSSTLWSSNISENGYLGLPADANWAPSDPRGLGGLVLQVSLAYDVDGDGYYNDQTSSYYDPTKPADEAYSALVYIQANPELAPPVCHGDCDCDGQVSFSDIDLFVAAIPDNQDGWAALYAERHGGAQPPCTFANCDVTGDGHVLFNDIDPFVALIPSACP